MNDEDEKHEELKSPVSFSDTGLFSFINIFSNTWRCSS